MKRYLVLIFAQYVILSLFAQIPDGYYNSAIGEKKEALKTALHNIIKDADVLSYGSGSGATWSGFAKTDALPNGTIWDMYSTNRPAVNGNSAASGMNIEHSFAKSWWGGTKNQAYKDLNHLYPSNSAANSARSNYPLGIVSNVTWENGVIKVGDCATCPSGTGKVWEPADEYKGDLARTYMYMVTAYENFSNSWAGNSAKQLNKNTYPVFQEWAIELLLEWSRKDPVSEKETKRNNEVYKIQKNRNPYIDYPLMAEYVWGRLTDMPFTPDGNVDYPYISTPSYGTIIDLGTVAYQHTGSATLHIKGINLTGDLSLSITGNDASLFSLSETTVSKDNAHAGYDITIYFKADEVGNRTASLQLSGGGVSPVSVVLNAFSTDDFMALPATYLSSTGFTANWTISANATDYVLDVYSMYNSSEVEYELFLEEDFNGSSLPSGWSKSGYTEINNGSVRLASGSNNGSVSTPTIQFGGLPSTLVVKAQQFSADNGAGLTVTLNGTQLVVWETTDDVEEYVLDAFETTQTGSLTFSAQKGERVYLDYVRVESTGSESEKISVAGYPKSVGNTLSYEVVGLEPDSLYYYTVTPEKNGAVVSNAISVRTLPEEGEVSLPDNISETVYWKTANKMLYVYNLPENCSLKLIDISGKQIIFVQDTSFKTQMLLPQRGVYILQIIGNGQSETIKVLY